MSGRRDRTTLINDRYCDSVIIRTLFIDLSLTFLDFGADRVLLDCQFVHFSL